LKRGKVPIDFDNIPKDRLLHYGCHDADLTRQLYYKQEEGIKEFRGPEAVDTHLQIPTLVEMERRGLLVNKEYLEALIPIFERSIARLEKRIYKVVGHTFDIFSPKQVGKVLFEEMGLMPLKLTKTGQPAVGAEDLERLAASSDNEVLSWIVEAKHHSHSLSGYIRGVLKGTCEKTGAVHASYGQTTAPTYRLSCTTGEIGGGGLNVQQIPKDPEILTVELADEEVENLKKVGVDVGHWDGKKIHEGHIPDEPGVYHVVYKARKCFVAREGYRFVSADYQAIEFRLIMNFAGEAKAGTAIREGLDGHKFIAGLLYRKDMDDITKEERNAVKTLNYGLAYGMSPWSLKMRLDMSEELAQELFNRYFNAMPRVKWYLNAVRKFARRSGYVTTYWGRKRNVEKEYIKDRNRGDRSACNTVIQGSAADAMRMALVKSHLLMKKLYGDKVHLVATLHDQIIFEVDESIPVEEFVPQVRKGMEMDDKDWLCHLPVDASFGQNWGDLEDWEEKSDEPEKIKEITIEILDGEGQSTIIEEIKLLLAELQEGDARLYIRRGGKAQEIKKVSYRKDLFEQFLESLGPLSHRVKVIVEDVTPQREPEEVKAGDS
jgi:DNA polymerase-1